MKNSFTLLFVFLSVCFCFFHNNYKQKESEGGGEGWEILFRGYTKQHLSSMLTLSAASDTVPCHEAGYFGTFLTWSWLEGQVLQFAEHLMARRALHFCQLRKLKESCRILQFPLKLKSPIYSRGTLSSYQRCHVGPFQHGALSEVCTYGAIVSTEICGESHPITWFNTPPRTPPSSGPPSKNSRVGQSLDDLTKFPRPLAKKKKEKKSRI